MTHTKGGGDGATARRQPAARPPLYAAEGVLRALLGLDLKVEGAGGGGPAGEVDEGDLVKADVHGRLVHVDEAALQRVEKPRAGLVGAGDALGSRVSVRANTATLHRWGSKRPPYSDTAARRSPSAAPPTEAPILAKPLPPDHRNERGKEGLVLLVELGGDPKQLA